MSRESCESWGMSHESWVMFACCQKRGATLTARCRPGQSWSQWSEYNSPQTFPQVQIRTHRVNIKLRGECDRSSLHIVTFFEETLTWALSNIHIRYSVEKTIGKAKIHFRFPKMKYSIYVKTTCCLVLFVYYALCGWGLPSYHYLQTIVKGTVAWDFRALFFLLHESV